MGYQKVFLVEDNAICMHDVDCYHGLKFFLREGRISSKMKIPTYFQPPSLPNFSVMQ